MKFFSTIFGRLLIFGVTIVFITVALNGYFFYYEQSSFLQKDVIGEPKILLKLAATYFILAVLIITPFVLIIARRFSREVDRITKFALNMSHNKGENIKIGHFSKEMDDITDSLNKASNMLYYDEVELILVKERYEMIFENNAAGIFVVDENRNIILANERFCEILGYAKDELVGHNAEMVHINQSAYESFAPNFLSVKNGQSVRIDYLLKHKSGELVWCELFGGRVELNSNKIGVVWSVIDITDQKKAEDELHLVSTALHHVSQGVLIAGLDRVIIYANKGFEDITGYSKEEVIGKKYSILYGKDTDSYTIDMMRASLDAYKPFSCEILNYRKDGTPFWNELSISPVLNHNGRVINFVSIQNDVTERREFEEKVKKSEEKFRKMFEMHDSIMYIIDPASGEIIDANISAAKFYGYSVEELRGMNISQINALSPSLVHEEMMKALREDKNFFIFPHKLKDGAIKTVEVHSSPVKIDDKEALFSVVIDVTAQKKAEMRLKESEEMLRAIYDILPVGISITDRNGNIVDCNIASEKLLGITKEEYLTRNYKSKEWQVLRSDMTLMPTEEYPSVKALAFQVPVYNEEMGIARDDGIVWLSVSAMPIINESYGVVIAYVDITQSRKKEEELNNERNFANTVFDTANSIIAVIDRNGSMVKFNKSAENFTGYSRDEIREPFFWANFLLPEQRDSVKSVFERVINGEITPRYENYWCSKDGKTKLFDWTNALILDDTERMTHLVTVGMDMTETKKIQKELLEAKLEAENANIAKSQFLANMSHEIRTPMNAIMGLSQLLLSMNLEHMQKDYVEKINSSSRLLLSIINDILDFSKIEAGILEFEYVNFNISDILSQLTAIFSQVAKNKGVELLFGVDSNIPTKLVGDKLRITQVLTNLLSNSIKFTQKGRIELEIKQKAVSDNRLLLEFIVKDTGIGISEDQMHKLFMPFTQADVSTTRKFGGTGLGLAISKKIITAMGGHIYARSVVGEGSVFGFEIELETGSDYSVRVNESKIARIAHQNGDDNKKQTVSLKGIKVLLVEDNEVNTEVASRILTRVGAAVYTATNGKEAVLMMSENPSKYNIILMDIQMPIMGGYEASSVIRETNKDIPIIALTAAVMVEDKQKAIDAGMNDYVSKPIDMYELLNTVLKWASKDNTSGAVMNSLKEENEEKITEELDYSLLSEVLGGDEVLVSRLLNLFLSDLGEKFGNLVEMIALKHPDAEKMTHALKGVSGNMHADKLSKVSAQINTFLKNGIPITPEILEELRDAINVTKSAIGKYLKTIDRSKIEALDARQLKVLLDDIKVKLQNGDMIKEDTISTVYSNLKDIIDDDILSRWRVAVDRFEYEEAYKIMEQWKIEAESI